MKLYECFGTDETTGNIIKCLVYSFFIIMDLNYDFALFLGGAMMIDMGLGVCKSTVLKKKISIKIFLFGFATKLALLIIPFTVAVLGISLGMEMKWTADLGIRILLANECLSILANVASIKTKKEVENVDLISMFIHWIRKSTLAVVEKMLNKNS